MNNENKESRYGWAIVLGLAMVMLFFLFLIGSFINEEIMKEMGDEEVVKEMKDIFDSFMPIIFGVLIIGTPLFVLALITAKKEDKDKIKYIDTETIKIELGDIADGIDAYHPSRRGKTL